MSSYEKCNTVVRASTVLFVVIYYTYLYILFMTILFALVNYWFNSFRWHSFSIEFVFIFRSRLYRIARTRVSPLYRFSHITCLHGFEFILICKQECFAAYFTTIRDFSPSFISFCIYNVSSGDISASAEYLRYGYYLTALSYIAGHGIDHPALLFALRFILCQTVIVGTVIWFSIRQVWILINFT